MSQDTLISPWSKRDLDRALRFLGMEEAAVAGLRYIFRHDRKSGDDEEFCRMWDQLSAFGASHRACEQGRVERSSKADMQRD